MFDVLEMLEWSFRWGRFEWFEFCAICAITIMVCVASFFVLRLAIRNRRNPFCPHCGHNLCTKRINKKNVECKRHGRFNVVKGEVSGGWRVT